jgi:hypothetical protein
MKNGKSLTENILGISLTVYTCGIFFIYNLLMIPYSSMTIFFPNSVKTLNNGTNYEDRKDSLYLYLSLHDFDLALRINKHANHINESLLKLRRPSMKKPLT